MWLNSVTIMEYERGVKYVHGKLSGVLEAGKYRYWGGSTKIVKVDMRPYFVQVAGQEVLTSDSVSLRVTVTGDYQVVDPVAALHTSQSLAGSSYNALQVALRDVTSAATIDDLLEKRADLGKLLFEHASEPFAALGLKLNSVGITDLMFPGEFKKAFAQIVVAKQEGLAALERARGETAALRNLANAAKLLADNPILVQLRAIQALEKGGGTLVLGDAPKVLPKG